MTLIALVVGAVVLALAALIGWLAFEDIRWDEHRWGLAKVKPVSPKTETGG